MSSDGAQIRRAEAILRDTCGDRVRTDFPMGPLTTFRIGGRAALYLEPESEGDLAAASAAVRETRIELLVVGKGSNILVSDAGFPGLVLRLGRGFRWTARDGERITAGAAMPLPALAGVALSHALGGLEFGVAIPASLGGALRMNAGAHGYSMSEIVEWVDVYALGRGEHVRVPASRAGFRYRESAFPEGSAIVGAGLRLVSADPSSIRARMDEAREWRRRTQPLAEPNCGSVFRNPEGDHAARLIEAAGLKGVAVGGASVSTKHANFIVASEAARAADVVALIRRIQDVVAARYDVHLDPEVHLVGEFDQRSG